MIGYNKSEIDKFTISATGGIAVRTSTTIGGTTAIKQDYRNKLEREKFTASNEVRIKVEA